MVLKGVVLRGGFILWFVVLMLVIQGGVFILWFEGVLDKVRVGMYFLDEGYHKYTPLLTLLFHRGNCKGWCGEVASSCWADGENGGLSCQTCYGLKSR